MAAIRAQGGDAAFVPTVDEIVSALAESLRPGDRVAILSNGGFGGIHERLLAALARSTGLSRPGRAPNALEPPCSL